MKNGENWMRKHRKQNRSFKRAICRKSIRSFKSYVEYMIQDYDKPMGVATYKTATDMPERLRKALPDQEELLKIIGSELNNNNK